VPLAWQPSVRIVLALVTGFALDTARVAAINRSLPGG